jgi:hypothetical protein
VSRHRPLCSPLGQQVHRRGSLIELKPPATLRVRRRRLPVVPVIAHPRDSATPRCPWPTPSLGPRPANTDRTAKCLALMRAAAETAVRLDPGLPRRTSCSVTTNRGLRDYDRALAEFAVGLERQPAHDELLSARGAVLRRMGRFAEAAPDLARAPISTRARRTEPSSSRRATPDCATILTRCATSNAPSRSIRDGPGCTPTSHCIPSGGVATWRRPGVL